MKNKYFDELKNMADPEDVLGIDETGNGANQSVGNKESGEQSSYETGEEDGADPEQTDETSEKTDEPQVKVFNLEGSLELSIKPDVKDMRKFMFSHNYRSIGGWFGVLISLFAVVMIIIGRERYNAIQLIALAAIAAMFILVQPIQLMMKAKRNLV